MPLSKSLESRLTVSVLKAVDAHLRRTYTQIAQLLSRTVQMLIPKLVAFVVD